MRDGVSARNVDVATSVDVDVAAGVDVDVWCNMVEVLRMLILLLVLMFMLMFSPKAKIFGCSPVFIIIQQVNIAFQGSLTILCCCQFILGTPA